MNARPSSPSMPRYLTVPFDLGMAEQKLHPSQVAGTPINQRCFCSPEGGSAGHLSPALDYGSCKRGQTIFACAHSPSPFSQGSFPCRLRGGMSAARLLTFR
jgi:hypothetical protein